MKISAKAEYACLALLALAQQSRGRTSTAHPRDLRVLTGFPSVTWSRSCSSSRERGWSSAPAGRRAAIAWLVPRRRSRSARSWPRSTARTHPSAVLPERNVRPRGSWAWSGTASAPRSAASSTAPPSPSSSRKPRLTNGPSEVIPASLLSGMQQEIRRRSFSVRVAGLAESQEMPFLPSSGSCQTFPGRNGRVDLVLWWEGA